MTQPEIYVIELDTKARFRFPVLPKEIAVRAAGRSQTYDIMNVGEIRFARGEALTVFSWECFLPGAARKKEPYLHGQWRDPKEIQGLWSMWRSRGQLLRLRVSGTPINHPVYLQDYTAKYSGFAGDYQYTISFYYAKDLKIYTEAELAGETGAAAAQESARPEPPTPKTYVTKSGDTLWGIAQKLLGSGARYPELHAVNQPPMSADPNVLMPGWTLKIP